MKILESYSAIANSLFIEAEVDDKEMIKYKESQLYEIPGQFAQKYNDLAQTKIKKKDGGEVTAATAAKSDYAKKDPATHKKAKSFLQKVKDKLTKKKDDEKPAPKKQSKSDADFYKRQFTGESIIIDGKQYHSIKESNPRTFKEIYDRTFRSLNGKNSLNEYSLSDSDNLWDPNGPEDRQVILKALKKDRKIMKVLGPKPYWDDVDLVSPDHDDETIATLRRNMTLKALKQAILKYRG